MTRKESADYVEHQILEMCILEDDNWNPPDGFERRLLMKPYPENSSNEPIDIVNDDGTPYDPPKNPLEEKWKKLYPPIPRPELSQVCDGYSCIYCGRCPMGDLWTIPEEDLGIWEEYLSRLDEYNKIHNPSLYRI